MKPYEAYTSWLVPAGVRRAQILLHDMLAANGSLKIWNISTGALLHTYEYVSQWSLLLIPSSPPNTMWLSHHIALRDLSCVLSLDTFVQVSRPGDHTAALYSTPITPAGKIFGSFTLYWLIYLPSHTYQVRRCTISELRLGQVMRRQLFDGNFFRS